MTQARPNILLITCDQWRADCVSAMGHALVRTPNVDALTREGVLFRRHYATAAPCSPARASIYTGLYQMNTRVCRNGTPLDARHGNVALHARALGYEPTLFGYTDVSPDPRLHAPLDPALKTYEGILPGFLPRVLLPEHQKAWLSWLKARGVDVSHGSPAIHQPADGVGQRVSLSPPAYSAEETPTAFLAGEFIRWLGEQDGGEPWFAHVSFLSPHPPFVVPAPYNTMYDPNDVPPSVRQDSLETEAASHPFLAYVLGRLRKDDYLPGMPGRVTDFDDEDIRRIRAIYYGMVSETDAQLGRLWSALKSAGIWDDTVIVLTSDHGEMLGDHFLLGKGGYFDAGYHVPLIVRDPRRPSRHGASVDAFTEAVDILPTLLDLMGAKIPAHLDGRALTPFLNGGPVPARWRDAAHWEFDFRSVATGVAERHFGLRSQQLNLSVIRDDRFKYVHFGGGLPPLLFDLHDDPGERRNLADDTHMLAKRIELAEKLLAWRAEHLDQTLALSALTENGVAGTFAPLVRPLV